MLDDAGEVVEEARLAARADALRHRFAAEPPVRIVLEAGTHSPWVSRLLSEYGHEVIVANPRKLRLIYQNDSKSDRVDAEYLARVGRLDPALLSPLTHRSAHTQADLALLRSRNALVRARTRLISHARGTTKSLGGRLPTCASQVFTDKAVPLLPMEVTPALAPMLTVIRELSAQIRALDGEIERLATERYPECALLTQVPGVGTLTALVFLLTLEDPERFRTSRAVGSYLAYVPARPTPVRSPHSCISPRLGTSTCAGSWWQRPTTSWGPSARILISGAGDSRWPSREAREARSGPWWPWPASLPCSFCVSG